MIDHVSLHVSDFEKAKLFYAQALKPLGYAVGMDLKEWSVAGLGADGKLDLWIKGDGVQQSAHVAFSASNKDQVDAFYNAALASGGRDNGKPGYRKEYNPGYYGAFVLDSDGHNIEVVFHDPAPSE